MAEAFKYKAFISYSHKDQKWARWLHRRLEQYRFPASAIGQETEVGPVPKSLKPIFRDRDDLTAGSSLGEIIETALDSSENLIVICSPNAVRSQWVSQEILYFKRRHRGARIFTVIVDGEPFASNLPRRQEDECLPEALRFEIGKDGELTDQQAEPLAADLRSEGDGRRLGTLKLVSGMVGLGLDDLVQRDLQRARRRVMGITGLASAVVLAMGTLTWLAVDARGEAEQRRADAEGLIEFMLTDLKEKLKSVGRLDALEAAGVKAAGYYDSYDNISADPGALGQRAQTFQFLGEIQDLQGNTEQARRYFLRSFEDTEKLLRDSPNNPDRIFTHAQSAYWMGWPIWNSGNYKEALPFYQKYFELSERLNKAEPDSIRSIMESAYSREMLGIMHYRLGNLDEALNYFKGAKSFYSKSMDEDSTLRQTQIDISNINAWISDAYRDFGNITEAKNFRVLQRNLLRDLLNAEPNDQHLRERLVGCQSAMIRLATLEGNLIEAENILNQQQELLASLIQVEDKNTETQILSMYNAVRFAIVKILLGDLVRAEEYIAEVEVGLDNPIWDNKESEDITHFIPRWVHILRINLAVQSGNISKAESEIDALNLLAAPFMKKSSADLTKEEVRTILEFQLYSIMLRPNQTQIKNINSIALDFDKTVFTQEYLRDLKIVADGKFKTDIRLDRLLAENQNSPGGSMVARSQSKLIQHRGRLK